MPRNLEDGSSKYTTRRRARTLSRLSRASTNESKAADYARLPESFIKLANAAAGQDHSVGVRRCHPRQISCEGNVLTYVHEASSLQSLLPPAQKHALNFLLLGSARMPCAHDVLSVFCASSSWAAPVYPLKCLPFSDPPSAHAVRTIKHDDAFFGRIYCLPPYISKLTH